MKRRTKIIILVNYLISNYLEKNKKTRALIVRILKCLCIFETAKRIKNIINNEVVKQREKYDYDHVMQEDVYIVSKRLQGKL